MPKFHRDPTPKIETVSLSEPQVATAGAGPTTIADESVTISEKVLGTLPVERYRSIAENASDVAWETDLDGNFTWVSASVEEVLGWTPAEFMTSREDDYCEPLDISRLTEMRERVRLGERVSRVELRYRTKAGGYRWMRVHRVPLQPDAGGDMRIVSGLYDETDEVSSRVRLQESEARYRQLVEHVGDLVMQVDNNDEIIWISPSVSTILGFTPEQLLGTLSWDLIHPDDRAKIEQSHEHPRNGLSAPGEIRVRTASGDYKWVAASSRVPRDARGVPTGRIITHREVSDEVRRRADLVATAERFRVLAENLNDIVCEVDRDGLVRWTSPSVKKELGYQAFTLLGQPIENWLDRADVPKLTAQLASVFAGEVPSPVELRAIDSTGTAHWMLSQVHPVRVNESSDIYAAVGFTNIDHEIVNREKFESTDARYRLLAENSNDVVLQCEESGLVEWASPSITAQLGYSPGDVVGTNLLKLAAADDELSLEAWWTLARVSDRVESREVRVRTLKGEPRWVSIQARPVLSSTGTLSTVVVTLRSIETEVTNRRALTTLTSGFLAMMHATTEAELLGEMCQLAVENGGYKLAWYGRKMWNSSRSIDIIASSRGKNTYLNDLQVTWADEPLGRGPSGTAVRTGLPVVANDFRNQASFSPWLAKAVESGMYSSVALPVSIGGTVDGVLTVYASELRAFDEFSVSVLEDLATALGHGLQRIRDQEKLIASLRDHQLLSSAIDQAGDSIVVSDPNSVIIYANPAVARTTGYELSELVGQNPRIFQSGLQSRTFYERMWETLTAGRTWRGILANRKKNGEIYEEDASISPIFDEEGVLMAYVAVKHDLTVERRLEADLHREVSDRDAVVDIMRDLHPAKTLEVTADAFCEAATRLEGVDAVAIAKVDHDGEFVTIANRGPQGLSSLIDGVSTSQLAELGFDLTGGPVQVAGRVTAPRAVALNDQLRAARIRGVVAAPIRWEGELIGALLLATRSDDDSTSSRFAYFEELATFAGTLMGAQAMMDLHNEALRDEIQDIIKNRRFHPVFQPFVDLTTNAIVGYEALTRFDDGMRPDLRFIDAHEVGLGSALEAACVSAALDEARDLDRGVFVSLNFSPDALLDGHAKSTVADTTLDVVIELTEHSPINDYTRVRRALDEIPGCRVAVDDAGAGYTSLRHILELRPDFVKLDISIVRNIDTDAARQAMAAAMCHFASHDGTVIIAEGIETAGEAEALRSIAAPMGLKAILGQGYYFAAPAPLTKD